MTIYNLGSINADYFYDVPHIPAEGETLAATGQRVGLGGKGANQSVAAALAGAEVHHLGAVGPDGDWAIDRLRELGVGVDHIRKVDTPTAHAIINVAADGENAIVIFSGANLVQPDDAISAGLENAKSGDLLILQNETAGQVEAAKIGKSKGMRVMYSAAPFHVEPVRAILDHVDILAVNQGEAAELVAALGVELGALPVEGVLVTLGADGADYHDVASGTVTHCDAVPVTPVDTTGAGDTFAGYFAAGLDAGFEISDALSRAAKAAALKVTRPGTADAIPTVQEVEAFNS